MEVNCELSVLTEPDVGDEGDVEVNCELPALTEPGVGNEGNAEAGYEVGFSTVRALSSTERAFIVEGNVCVEAISRTDRALGVESEAEGSGSHSLASQLDGKTVSVTVTGDDC